MPRSLVRHLAAFGALLGVVSCSSTSEPATTPVVLTVLSGYDQTAPAATRLPQDVVILVSDSTGAGLPGITVRFTITSGGGSVSEDEVVSDANGVATTSWTLGIPGGIQGLAARVTSSGQQVVVNVSATSRVIGSLTLAGGSSLAVPAGIAIPLQATVLDSLGVPFEGVWVKFVATGGTVSFDSLLTDPLGQVSAQWTTANVANQSVAVSVVRPGRSTLTQGVAATLFAPTRVSVAGGPYGMSVAASGLVYATRLNDAAVAIGSVSGKNVTGSIPVGAAPTGVTINPAGTEAYVTNQLSANIGVIDVATSTQVTTIPFGHNPFVVTFSANGATAYVATNQGMIYSINTATRAKTDSVMTGNGSNGLAITPNGSRMYVSAFAAGRIYEIDLATFDVTRTFIANVGTPQGVVVSQDGSELYVADQNGAVQVWTLATGVRAASIPVANGGFGLAMSPNGATLYATSMTGWVTQIDRATRTITKSYYVGGDPRRIGVSADGQTLVVANLFGWIDYIF